MKIAYFAFYNLLFSTRKCPIKVGTFVQSKRCLPACFSCCNTAENDSRKESRSQHFTFRMQWTCCVRIISQGQIPITGTATESWENLSTYILNLHLICFFISAQDQSWKRSTRHFSAPFMNSRNVRILKSRGSRGEKKHENCGANQISVPINLNNQTLWGRKNANRTHLPCKMHDGTACCYAHFHWTLQSSVACHLCAISAFTAGGKFVYSVLCSADT